MVRSLKMLSGAGLMLGLSAMVWAGPQSACPRPCPNVCVPNAANFGYFPTTWRQWPGEQPLEQTNPQAIGKQVLPTPVGQEPLPPVVPSPETPPEAGTIVPPGGALAPEPSPPTTPAPSSTPSIEGGLPGLPVEPDQSPRPPASRSESPKETPKAQAPAKDKTMLPKVWRGPAEQGTKAAEFSENQVAARSDVVAIVVGAEQKRSELSAREERANGIADAPEPITAKVETTAYVAPEPAAQPPAIDKVALPPVALNSYCVVELVKNGRWVKGDLRWTVVHQGWIFRFSGPAQRQQFLANPEAFVPANSGNDPVLATDESRSVPGEMAYCALYNGRLYMFSGAATQARFNERPQRYAVAGK